jgi:hypothetical protein
MLEIIKKAEKSGLLTEIKDEWLCPVPMPVIKNYLAIISNANFFNIGLQRQFATMAEIIPYVLKCISSWNSIREKTSTNGKTTMRSINYRI